MMLLFSTENSIIQPFAPGLRDAKSVDSKASERKMWTIWYRQQKAKGYRFEPMFLKRFL